MPIFLYGRLDISNEITASLNPGNITTNVLYLGFFTFRRRYRLVTHGIGQELGHVVVCLFIGVIDPLIYYNHHFEPLLSLVLNQRRDPSQFKRRAYKSLIIEKSAPRCLTM